MNTLITIVVLFSSFHLVQVGKCWHAAIERYLALRTAIIANPKLAVERYCRATDLDHRGPGGFELRLEWRVDREFQSPCDQGRMPPVIPIRYYRVRLIAPVIPGMPRLGELDLERTYFR